MRETVTKEVRVVRKTLSTQMRDTFVMRVSPFLTIDSQMVTTSIRTRMAIEQALIILFLSILVMSTTG